MKKDPRTTMQSHCICSEAGGRAYPSKSYLVEALTPVDELTTLSKRATLAQRSSCNRGSRSASAKEALPNLAPTRSSLSRMAHGQAIVSLDSIITGCRASIIERHISARVRPTFQ
ncbi:unnamed protein product [Cercospora beticola]|nr:unnamed protein product [Cercospora beticola]